MRITTSSLHLRSTAEADFSLRFSKDKIKVQSSQNATKSWDLGHIQVPFKPREINTAYSDTQQVPIMVKFFGREKEKL